MKEILKKEIMEEGIGLMQLKIDSAKLIYY
jgi:hypothetical protein